MMMLNCFSCVFSLYLCCCFIKALEITGVNDNKLFLASPTSTSITTYTSFSFHQVSSSIFPIHSNYY